MPILNDLITSLPEDSPVRSVLVGERWTVVCSRHCGMSATLRSEPLHEQVPILDHGRLHQMSARELAEWAYSADLLEASIGIAAINSLLEVDESLTAEINASEVLSSCGRGKDVALVGRFSFIPPLRQAARQLWVIEQQPAEGEYPPETAVELLPEADVVAITGSTLINHTLDELLALCDPQATVMVLGPSTPISPVLFRHGVNILCGTRVVDEPALLQTVDQATSLSQVEGVKLLTHVAQKKM